MATDTTCRLAKPTPLPPEQWPDIDHIKPMRLLTHILDLSWSGADGQLLKTAREWANTEHLLAVKQRRVANQERAPAKQADQIANDERQTAQNSRLRFVRLESIQTRSDGALDTNA